MHRTEDAFSQFVSKKAYEISYALFRMASSVKRPSFADHLENRGLSFLVATTTEDYAGARIIARGIEHLLRFGADVGVVSQTNTLVVIEELAAFNAAIAELEKSAKVTAVNLEDIFSKMPAPFQKTEMTVNRDGGRDEVSATDRNFLISENGQNNSGHNVVKSAMRQSTILERVRQNGNCRLKDIQEFLPETSDRTLRYDVQNLIERGLIERVGNGGPATYYKSRE